MERITLLKKLRESYLLQKEYTESEQWNFWEKVHADTENIHNLLQSIGYNNYSNDEEIFVKDIVRLYDEIKIILKNKCVKIEDELTKIDEEKKILHEERLKLLKQYNMLLSEIPQRPDSVVLSVTC